MMNEMSKLCSVKGHYEDVLTALAIAMQMKEIK